jgi:hypothetical protein
MVNFVGIDPPTFVLHDVNDPVLLEDERLFT